MKNNFLVVSQWLDNLEYLPVEKRKDAYYDMLRYAVYGEDITTQDPMILMGLGFIFPQINNMQSSYEDCINKGSKNGKNKKVNDNEILRYAR